jgi:predicted amidohydrolase YtcJ
MNNKIGLINGNGITMNSISPKCEAIYIKDGLIEAIGSTKEISVLANIEDAELIDLNGKTFFPGFHDCHVHMMNTGIASIGINLFECRSIDEVFETLEKERPKDKDQWIYGYGLDESRLKEKHLPTLQELDQHFGESDLYLVDRGLHYTLVNTLAMEKIGFSGEEKGLIVDEFGNRTGRLHEEANSKARKYFYDKLTWEQREAAIQYTAFQASKVGVTTIHAMEGGDLSSDYDIPVFLKLMETLPVHVVLHWCSENYHEVLDKKLKAIGTDILLDGSIGSRTAAFKKPYADNPKTSGVLYYDDQWVIDYIVNAHKNGLQTGFHAIGQKAIHQVLNCLEKALTIYPVDDHRFRIEHCGFPDKKDIKRAKKLGAVISTQPSFTYLRGGPDSVYCERVGSKRNCRAYPIREFLDAGIVVNGGSDSGVTPMNPLLGIHAAVNPPYHQNAITVKEALRLFTIDGAYTGKEEKERGSLELGKVGDITVLAENPLEVLSEKIKDISVEMTVYQGNIVFQK